MTTPGTGHQLRPLSPTQATPISPAALPDTVTVVPLIDELGCCYLRHHVYIHDAQLPDQIRLDTTHLGYSVLGQL